MYQLELDGTVVVDRRVAALDVVEAVDVVADRQRGTGAALEVIDSFELALEGREEALGDGIIPAISLPTHAALEAFGVQGLSVVGARVRAAAIGVVNETGGRAPPRQRRVQRGEREVAIDNVLAVVAQPTTRLEEQVQNHGQVQLKTPRMP